MIVPFVDSVTGAAVYINPDFVLTLRPDPAQPEEVSIVKLNDGEAVRVRGEHGEVARRLAA